MDELAAKSLLSSIQTQKEKQAGGLSKVIDWFNYSNPGRIHELQDLQKAQLEKNTQNNILNALMLAFGGAAALRGGLGISRMFSDTKPVKSRVVPMEVPYRSPEESEEKKANDHEASTVFGKVMNSVGLGPQQSPDATEATGIGGYLPSLLIGTPLAAYAGWKGVDAIFNSQRQAKTKRKLEKAKERYEQAILDSYAEKDAASNDPFETLDVVFEKFEKTAELDLFSPSTWFPNAGGRLKGLLATYALLSGPAAYLYVNDKMRKASKRSILESAMKERARRYAEQSPAELYAIPSPQSNKQEEFQEDESV